MTHTLRIWHGDAATALVPLIVREIDGDRARPTRSRPTATRARPSRAAASAAASEVDWSATGLVSIFARERLIGEPWLDGAARALPRARPRPRARAPACARGSPSRCAPTSARAGRSSRAPGPSRRPPTATRSPPPTSRRCAGPAPPSATSSPASTSTRCSRSSRAGCSSRGAGASVGAAAIAAVSDGVLHYYLGGTADAARDASPFKNVVVAMLDLADELELPLNLGGGVTAGDGLEEFKRGFANSDLPFRTHEVVCDAGRVRAAQRRPRGRRVLPGLPGRGERHSLAARPRRRAGSWSAASPPRRTPRSAPGSAAAGRRSARSSASPGQAV